MMIFCFNKAILLVLPIIWSLMECQAIVSKAKCLSDCSIVKQETQEFYCTAAQIYGELKTQNLDSLQPFLSENNFNKRSVSIMLDVFSDTCKIHTTIMMYKHQLEHHMQGHPNEHLYAISAALQNAANTLENIEEKSNNLACIEFTSEEYTMIYTLLYDNRPLLASLMEQVKKWIQVEDYYNSFGYSISHFKDC